MAVPSQTIAEASKELTSYIILAELVFFAVSIVIALPYLFRHISSGRVRKGWFFRAAAKPPKSEITISPDVNLTTGPKTLQSSSFVFVTSRKLYNSTLLRVVPILGLTVGQFLVIVAFLALFVFGQIYKNLKAPQTNFKRPAWVAVTSLPLLFILAMKNTPLGLSGKGYERLNFIHRFVGRLIILAAYGHGALWLRMKLVAKRPIVFQGHSLTGLIALISFSLILLTSLRPFRSRFYQTFLFFHVTGYIAVLFSLWYHTPSIRPFVGFAFGALGLNYIQTLIKTRYAKAILHSYPMGMTRIEVNGIGDGWRAGQHVYLRVMKGRQIFEKHPFTIVNTPTSNARNGRNTLVLIARAVGKFTKNIHAVGLGQKLQIDLEDPKSEYDEKEKDARSPVSNSVGSSVSVILEGPYGVSYVDLCQFETVLLVGGGSGFTYCAATLMDIVESHRIRAVRTRRVYVTWVLRDLRMAQVFSEVLNETLNLAQDVGLEIVFRIHLTTALAIAEVNPISSAHLAQSRPDLPGLLHQILVHTATARDFRGAACSGGVGIGACGPASLITSLRNSVGKVDGSLVKQSGGITLHSEKFDW